MIKHTQLIDDYLAASIWTALDDDGYNMDEYSIHDFDSKARERANKDLERFVSECGDLLEKAIETGNYTIDMIGHDYSLSRCGHGTGFWDRGLGEIGKRLSNIAHAHGDISVFAENGTLYFDNC